MVETTIEVEGMSCGGCADKISKRLSALAGVAQVTVALAENVVKVSHDSAVGQEDLRDAIEALGFDCPR